jgi:hypothetical protein
MSGSGLVVRSAPPAHRAAPNRRRLSVALAAVVATLGGIAVTSLLLGPEASPGAEGTAHQAVTDLDAVPVVEQTGSVTCWDGTRASLVTECGVPSGRDGVATIFPSLDRSCAATAPVVAGKAEVFTCRASDYVIRYTRWEQGFDRFSVFSEANRGPGSEWTVGHEFAGRSWASREQVGNGVRHFRWTATYRAQPFSVEVQATSLAGRAAGMAAVDAVAPRHLGRG